MEKMNPTSTRPDHHTECDIYSITRRNSSRNGNPAWTIHTSKGSFNTATDAAVSYGIENIFGSNVSQWDRDNARLILNRSGKVVGVVLANGKQI